MWLNVSFVTFTIIFWCVLYLYAHSCQASVYHANGINDSPMWKLVEACVMNWHISSILCCNETGHPSSLNHQKVFEHKCSWLPSHDPSDEGTDHSCWEKSLHFGNGKTKSCKTRQFSRGKIQLGCDMITSYFPIFQLQ